MSSSNPKQRFEDIVFNINRILSYLNGYSFEQFADDPKTVDAVERCMQRITEAAIKLEPLNAQLLPEQDWVSMRGFGNALRHDYDLISEKIIWDIAKTKLPELKIDCERAIQTLEAAS